VIFIANYWTTNSPPDVRIFSNCEEVALYLNGKLIEKRRPDNSRTSTNLRHPPFTFKLDQFEPGTLLAIGYIGGREVARVERRTPGEIDKLKLQFDLSGKPFASGGKDVIFCHANLEDKNGTIVPTANTPIFFGATGETKLIGDNPIAGEAGTGTILLQSDIKKPRCAVYAVSLIKDKDQIRILSAAASPDGRRASDYKVHYATDGGEPSAASPVYSKPVRYSPQLRVAIVVNGRIVARIDARASAPFNH
jgi:beta-galactosidase